VLYTLRRRQLGKAVNSSMKQAVIAVCNPEGAHSQYKKLLDIVNSLSDR
jgi:hypothetical protein